MSEGYRTPPPTTPIPDNREASLVNTSLSSDVMSQSFFTPVVLSREGSNSRGEFTLSNGKGSSHVIEEERGEGGDSPLTHLEDNMESYQDHKVGGAMHQKGVVINPSVGEEENHYEFDQYQPIDHTKKISTGSMISNCSDGSLVITKAVSEIFSEGRSTPDQGLSQQEEGVSLYVDGAVPHPIDLEESMVIPDDHSPVAELLESASEGEDTVHREMFMASTRQGGAPALGTILSPTRKRKDEVSKQ